MARNSGPGSAAGAVRNPGKVAQHRVAGTERVGTGSSGALRPLSGAAGRNKALGTGQITAGSALTAGTVTDRGYNRSALESMDGSSGAHAGSSPMKGDFSGRRSGDGAGSGGGGNGQAKRMDASVVPVADGGKSGSASASRLRPPTHKSDDGNASARGTHGGASGMTGTKNLSAVPVQNGGKSALARYAQNRSSR